MKKFLSFFVALFALVLVTRPALAVSSVVYDALPSVVPATNYPSLGFQATQTKEFGDYIHLAGTSRIVDKVTVTMSDWAVYSDYLLDIRYLGNSTTWTHPVTLNVYSVVSGSPNTVGALLGTVTQSITIPWRPAEDSTNCPTKTTSGYKYKFQSIPGAPDTNCLNGLAFNAVFDLSSLNLTLPDDVIVSLAFNTNTWGYNPLNVAGPYESLNVAVPVDQIVAQGSDDNVNRVFWNSVTSTGGIFREDTDWTPNGTVAMKITANSPLVSPTDKNQCKDNGWQIFNNPVFKNQGDCVSFLQSNGKALGNKNK